MKRRTEKWMNWTVAIVLFTQVAMAVGWFVLRPRHRDLFENGTLKLQTVAAWGTRLPHAHAEIRGASMQVYGRIIAERAAAEQTGSILVLIVSPDRNELGRVITGYQLSSRLPKGGGAFSVELPLVPPNGSEVRISWGPTTKE